MLSLRLPESLHKQLKVVAEREGVSINQFIATTVAEKLSALMTVAYLEERAAHGDRGRFDRVLAKVEVADIVPPLSRDIDPAFLTCPSYSQSHRARRGPSDYAVDGMQPATALTDSQRLT